MNLKGNIDKWERAKNDSIAVTMTSMVRGEVHTSGTTCIVVGKIEIAAPPGVFKKIPIGSKVTITVEFTDD